MEGQAMSTVADCPDADTCPGVGHEWTPEPTVIHNPRLCLRGSNTALWWHLLNDHGIGPHYLHGNPWNIHGALVAGGACEGWKP